MMLYRDANILIILCVAIGLKHIPRMDVQGSFIVNGVTTFEACFIIGGSESSPGKGGAIFNEVNGYIAFDGGVNIKDTFLTVSIRHA